MFPIVSRLRMLRNWGGIVDTTPDRSPILGKTPVPGLFVNCGWGTGGFKATPGSGHVFAPSAGDRRAASDRRAVRARPLPLRRADQRGDRRRRRALRQSAMLLIRCPYCEMERPEVEFKYGGQAHLTRPIRKRRPTRNGPNSSIFATTFGAAGRALAPRRRMRTVLQLHPRHGERQNCRHL